MKILKVFLVVALTILDVGIYAQIKVLSTGAVATGSIIPTGYDASFYGRYFFFGNNSYKGWDNTILKFDFSNQYPRLWSPSGTLVFYNNDNRNFNDIQIQNCYQISDSNLATNIQPLKNCLNYIKLLKGVSYNLRNTADSITKTSVSAIQYGFIAQDVQKIFPNLVTSNDSSKSELLNYTGLIPVLVESIKQLTIKALTDSTNYSNALSYLKNKISNDSLNFANQINALTTKLSKCCGNSTTTNENNEVPHSTIYDNSRNINQQSASLEQNAPNPFNQNTSIGYYIPDNVINAVLYIYNLEGIEIKSMPIADRGKSSITVYGNSLVAGMYIYTLITDGVVADTKRMILTN